MFLLPPTPSVGDEVTVGLISSHLVGHCCFSLVAFFGVLACGTSVAISNVKTMGPTMVVVVAEPSASMAFGRSDASGFGGTAVQGVVGLALPLQLGVGQVVA